MAEFWFNIETGAVEEGRQSPWDKVMGPYPTREAAESALNRAQQQSDAWDEADEEWRKD